MNADADHVDSGNARYRRVILRVGIVFLAVLIVLTFLSRTILTLTLPRVETTEPSSGPLIREIRADGTISATEKTELYVNARTRVHEMRARPGDAVRSGAVLAVLDVGDLQADLDQVIVAYDRGAGTLEDLLSPVAAARVVTLEGAIELTRMKVEGLTKNVENLKALQAIGSESADTVNRARLELMQATQDLTERQDAYDQRRSSILADLQSAVIVSPADAMITGVNGVQGAWVDSAQPVVTLLPRTAGLELKLNMPADKAKLIAVGETVEVRSSDRTAEGTIQRIAENPAVGGGAREVTITLSRESDLRAGDAGEVSIRKQTRPYPLLVPNSAVGRDSQGPIVYVLRERGGALGTEYFAIKSAVVVEDSDDFMTAISSGMEPTEKVVVHWSKQIAGSGSRVIFEQEK